MLKSKCIRVEREPSDGLRISVMSKHTLDDGKTPDATITGDMYMQWWPRLGPPLDLIGPYVRGEIDWDDYARKYKSYLNGDFPRAMTQQLAETALARNVTVLCIEEAPDHCHRRLLVERCQLIIPELEVILL